MDSYVLVPREATVQMESAGYNALRPIFEDELCEPNPNDNGVAYAAMLAARPSHCDDLLKAMEECERASDAVYRWVRKQIEEREHYGPFDAFDEEIEPWKTLGNALSRLSTLRASTNEKQKL